MYDQDGGRRRRLERLIPAALASLWEQAESEGSPMAEKRILCTIGFSQKSLRQFIHLLASAGVTKVIDTRLYNTSQLAGFAKKDDLAFILETFGIEYEHVPDLAPTDEIMTKFKKLDKDWEAFAREFNQLLAERQVAKLWTSPVFASRVHCLLCAEHSERHCHRRLVAEYFQRLDPEIEIRHLK
jgi:uncharacterized protein (DUF488 family)